MKNRKEFLTAGAILGAGALIAPWLPLKPSKLTYEKKKAEVYAYLESMSKHIVFEPANHETKKMIEFALNSHPYIGESLVNFDGDSVKIDVSMTIDGTKDFVNIRCEIKSVSADLSEV